MAKHEATIAQSGEILDAETVETTAAVPAAVAANAVAIPAAATPMAMIDRALASGAPIETLERLMALQERWQAGEARKAFDAAIALAKAEIGPIEKNRRVFFKGKNGGADTDYRFEDLAAVARAVDPVLSRHGLSYRHRTNQHGTALTVTCVLSHRDGYSEETTLSAQNDTSGNKNTIQGVGSTQTYLMRYTLKAALGLSVSHDDDGRTAEPQAQTEDAAPAELTARQAAELRRLVEETGTDVTLFLKAAKATAIEDITPAAFEKLRARLLEKKAKAAPAPAAVAAE